MASSNFFKDHQTVLIVSGILIFVVVLLVIVASVVVVRRRKALSSKVKPQGSFKSLIRSNSDESLLEDDTDADDGEYYTIQ